MKKKGQGFAKRVTLENIGDFEPLLGSEREKKAAFAQAGKKEGKASASRKKAEDLFNGESIKVKVPFKPLSGKKKTKPNKEKAKSKQVEVERKQAEPKRLERGTLLWQKKLSATDAQNPPDPDGHPTRCIKLTQARFKVDDEYIDHKTYFRDTVFSKLSWQMEIPAFSLESANVDIEFLISGKNYGVQKLSVRHSPKWVSGQGNAATQLLWADMFRVIRSINPTGKTLKLFAVKGKAKRFVIEIV